MMTVRILWKDDSKEIATFENVVKIEDNKVFIKYLEETPIEFPAEFFEMRID